MGLYLDASTLRRLAAAQRVMLAPLAYADTEAWVLAVNGHLRRLLGADHTVAFVWDERGIVYFSDDTETELLHPVRDQFLGYDEAGYATFEPAHGEPAGIHFAERLHRLRRSNGSGAQHELFLDAIREVKRADLFQSTHIPAGMCYMSGLGTPLPVGEVCTCIAFERNDAEGYSEEGFQKLELLVPAYEAGVRAWQRMEGFREALDVAGEPLAVFGPEGDMLFESRALADLLGDDPEARTVVVAMGALARKLHGWRPRRGRKATVDEPVAEEVATERRAYRMRGSALRPSVFGTEAVLVALAPLDPVLPTIDEARERLGLTARQAEVALLIAEGLDNRAVAERLFISPHTARRHTERVLRKLGVGSRSAVAVSLLRGGIAMA